MSTREKKTIYKVNIAKRLVKIHSCLKSKNIKA